MKIQDLIVGKLQHARNKKQEIENEIQKKRKEVDVLQGQLYLMGDFIGELKDLKKHIE